MTALKKHCDTCAYSFFQMDGKRYLPEGRTLMQHCSHRDYIAVADKKQMENGSYCDFWSPKKRKGF